MTDLRKLSEAEYADDPGSFEYIRAASECYRQYRSGKLAEAGPLLALLAEARPFVQMAKIFEERGADTTLSRIDDALAAEREARG